MQRIKSLVTALDILGAGALLAASLSVVNVLGIVAVVPEAEALNLFTSAFGTAVLAFTLARTVQIGDLMRTRVNPRRARELRASQVEALPQADTSPAVPNPFQRAA